MTICIKGEVLAQLGKEPYEDAVTVRANFETRFIQWRIMLEKQGAGKDESIRNDASVILST